MQQQPFYLRKREKGRPLSPSPPPIGGGNENKRPSRFLIGTLGGAQQQAGPDAGAQQGQYYDADYKVVDDDENNKK